MTTFLIFVGAMVTTKDAGLSVPDWPLSFGSLNPPGWWHMEGVNWEHGHRLTGAMIGLLVVGLAVGMWRTYPASRLRWLGVAALVGVCIQGLFGGLRVTEVSTPLAVVHGCFAQLFFGLLVVIAAVTSPTLEERFVAADHGRLLKLRSAAATFVGVTYVQLIIAATMRHYKAGLAIPDFPLALGQIVPPLVSFGVTIHFMHRVWALAVIAAAVSLMITAFRLFPRERNIIRGTSLIFWLLLLQVALGAAVIWHLRAPIPTSLHVVNGAGILAMGFYILTQSFAPIGAEKRIRSRKILEEQPELDTTEMVL